MQHLIIGAGPAGVVAAESIRQYDKSTTVTLVGAEPEPPYSRLGIPRYIEGKISEQETYLRQGPGYFAERAIDLRQGYVIKVDVPNNCVYLADGSCLEYDRLLIATGTSPIKPRIPGTDLPGVINCWTLDDARKISARLKPGSDVIVVGGGFTGCVVLDSLARVGARLTLIERQQRLLPHLMIDTASALVQRWCQSNDISVYTSNSISSIEPAAAWRSSGEPNETSLLVRLTDSRTLRASMVIFAVGTSTNKAFLNGSGIQIDRGVLVDNRLQTNVPKVYAAGDVCQGATLMDYRRRVQSLPLAVREQGQTAAANMCGLKASYVGSIGMNVLDTMGLVSASFGHWQAGKGIEQSSWSDAAAYGHIDLRIGDDSLIGASVVGNTRIVRVLPELIERGTPLGIWKQRLLKNPERVLEAHQELLGRDTGT